VTAPDIDLDALECAAQETSDRVMLAPAVVLELVRRLREAEAIISTMRS
jgi:hypothetical protein